MVDKIRPNNNTRSQGVPIDDEVEAVLTVQYLYNPFTDQYEVATPGSVGDAVSVKRATDGNLINPATEDTLALVKAATDSLLTATEAIRVATEALNNTHYRRTDALPNGLNTIGYIMDNGGRKLVEGKIFFISTKLTLSAVQPNGSILLTNPVGSGKSVTLFRFDLSTDVTNEIVYFKDGSSTGAVLAKHNAFIDHPNPSVAEVRAGVGVYTPGTQIGIGRLTNTGPQSVDIAFVLLPGESVCVRYNNISAAGSNFYVSGFWIEEAL